MVAIGNFPSIGAAMMVLRPALESTASRRANRPAATASALRERHGDDAILQAALDADTKPRRQDWLSVVRALDDCEEQK